MYATWGHAIKNHGANGKIAWNYFQKRDDPITIQAKHCQMRPKHAIRDEGNARLVLRKKASYVSVAQ